MFENEKNWLKLIRLKKSSHAVKDVIIRLGPTLSKYLWLLVCVITRWSSFKFLNLDAISLV